MTVVTETDPTPQDVSFGCTVDDVLRLLPGVQLGAPLAADAPTPSNSYYQSPQVRKLTADDVTAFIQSVGSRVLARIYRYEQVPDRVREHIHTMARDLVATGAAHYVQAARHPAASGPNNGAAYADRLWQRFQTDLDDVKATIEGELENPTPGMTAGAVSGSFPDPFFPDEMRF